METVETVEAIEYVEKCGNVWKRVGTCGNVWNRMEHIGMCKEMMNVQTLGKLLEMVETGSGSTTPCRCPPRIGIRYR